MSDQIDGYAAALLAVANAEGNIETTRSQLTDVARAVDANEDLRSTLSNNLLPAAVRGQIVDDVLANKTSDTTRALVGMIVSAGHGGQLSSIVESFGRQAAGGSGQQMATVRSAVALTDDQKNRLASALSAKAGKPIQLENVVDPDLVGGAVTTMGDTVIDGSLRTRIAQMREAL